MASVSLTIDSSKQSPCVKLRIIANRRNTSLALGIRLESPEQWNPDHPSGPVIGHPAAKSINALLRARLAMANEVLMTAMANQEAITIELLRSRILEKISPEKAKEMDKPKDTLLEWLHTYQRKAAGRTRELYMITEKRISDFAIFHESGIDPRDDLAIHRHPDATRKGEKYLLNLTLQDITPYWLFQFDSYLAQYMGVNSRAIHLRNLRAVLKCAIRNDVELKDPFLKFQIKREETRHRALTPEQFKILFTYDIPKQEKELIEYRDIALLVFLLIGINIADLYEATSLTNGRLEYTRRKTHRHYSIKVEPEALDIINRYKGRSHLLRYADTNQSHMSLTKKLDRSLKRIGPITYIPSATHNHQPFKRWNGLFPGISVYWLRHTWATFAAKIGIPRDTIAKCLGHGKKTVTDIYIDFDQALIDEANRHVIDYALSLLK